MKERIRSVLSKVFNVPLASLPDDVAFGDLPEWNTSGHRKLVAEIQKEFQIRIDSEEVQEMISLKNIHAVVSSHVEDVEP